MRCILNKENQFFEESRPTLLDSKGYGIFITFEGLDGCGKTTQAHKASQWFREQGYSVLYTREPGGTMVSEQIRSILLNPENSNLAVQTELLLYLAARLQHLQELILPAMEKGQLVLCDRFHDSTVAYQGFGRRLELKGIQTIVQEWIEPHYPTLTVLLKITPQIAMLRMKQQRAGKRNRLDKESISFFERVAEGYATLVEKAPERFVQLDASWSIESVHQAVIAALSKRLRL